MAITFYMTAPTPIDNSLINFIMPHGPYDTIHYQFALMPDNQQDYTTRLVSGYDKTRQVAMRAKIIKSSELHDVVFEKNCYVISMIRLPFVSETLMVSDKFTVPPTPVKVYTESALEVWHIFSVKKHKESTSFKKVTGIIMDGVVIEKELMILNGNIYAGFIKALTEKKMVRQDVPILAMTAPATPIGANEIILALQ
ncbi:EP23 [Operophtera brumata nucleopolyhedrovirus]|uniref:EP23 n=1 Tax=Operophtera brumata nucleopolyhedrovirus TaxID=1046267 RepID=A0A2H4UZM1_9ABAC|nr:EP23 [Operophtera brumata nucleopolyhedrovirus]AUA60242.1 EP23 [Operophtera brumata nucleopolyhedrovirus]